MKDAWRGEGGGWARGGGGGGCGRRRLEIVAGDENVKQGVWKGGSRMEVGEGVRGGMEGEGLRRGHQGGIVERGGTQRGVQGL